VPPVGCPEASVRSAVRCVTTEKSADLTYVRRSGSLNSRIRQLLVLSLYLRVLDVMAYIHDAFTLRRDLRGTHEVRASREKLATKSFDDLCLQ
jgi:hypothetical protein